MISKQINFFTIPQDICEISSFIKERQIKILKRNLEYPPREYDIESNKENVFQVYLSKDFTSFFDETNNDKSSEEIDIFSSIYIEFGIGGFYPYSNKELHRSRFYYVSEYYENDQRVKKNEDFTNWADDFLKNFKKKFLHKSIEYSGLLMTKNCLEWAKTNNGTLSGDGVKFIIE